MRLRTKAEAFTTIGKAGYRFNRKGCDRVDLGPVSAVIYKMEK